MDGLPWGRRRIANPTLLSLSWSSSRPSTCHLDELPTLKQRVAWGWCNHRHLRSDEGLFALFLQGVVQRVFSFAVPSFITSFHYHYCYFYFLHCGCGPQLDCRHPIHCWLHSQQELYTPKCPRHHWKSQFPANGRLKPAHTVIDIHNPIRLFTSWPLLTCLVKNCIM